VAALNSEFVGNF